MDRLRYRVKIRGNFLAIPTPFHSDYSLNLMSLRKIIRRLLDAGYRTGNGILLIGGAAGEFYAMETEERKQVAEAAVEEAGGRIPVIIGAQHTSTLTILELARFAERIGADGIQVSPPYYEPPSPDDVFDLFKAVSDGADIPLVVYNTWWTGRNADVNYEQTVRLLELANVGAIKWSSPNPAIYESVLRDFAHQIPIIDNQIHEVYSHMLGAVAFTSHTALAWPEYGLRLWEDLEQKRYADAVELIKQLRIPFYRLFYKAFAFSGCEGHFDKAILELVGEPAGLPRPPGRPLPPELLEEMRTMLRNAGVPGLVSV
jgi:4-hydroxy-tetrahydrodipicolinate synthase